MEYILLFISASIVNNFVLSRFLGICPFIGVSKKLDTSIGMSLAVIFVMGVAGIVTWIIQYGILNPLNLGYLQTIIFILVIAALVQFVEMVIEKTAPALYSSLGIFLPLITTNCAVLGSAILNIQNNFSFLKMLIFTIGSAVGFALSLTIFAGIRERIELSDIPFYFRGLPITLITAGILSLAFMGFSGLVK
ncbi:electron transport complex subunit RsxA [Calditerrivibrio nitroreducens]|uniref:Ion-translocating oxidoreductase complex subunit A n=1 Tax=Calditerrivibrio nitroreducens (strain DSM 19672 / NBRC 101217 / Yu37-1) TaxID=768670 RepID=E4TFN0_CALNY|nr:electron transport complex subunit RsxA [Calditerrivibrio nitroreducens]ADR18498.1 electron transport complex, RnfABCDGE type, A subunit [Calditerrivibrio nitroreducens DSM 19672]